MPGSTSRSTDQEAAPLRGWKQIAAYLHRNVRTVQRWERTEGLCVRRRQHAKLGSVYAMPAELETWLALRTSSPGVNRFPTQSPEAYNLYLRARQHVHQFRRDSFRRARALFDGARAADPGFALAHAGFADCCAYLYLYWEPDQANLAAADSASRKAVALSPELAQAHASRGVALSTLRNHAEAEEEFRRAVELDPQLFDAHYFHGRACLAQGKFREAIPKLQAACKVCPEDYQAPALLAQAYIGLGSTASARRACRKTIELVKEHQSVNPGDVRALYLGANCLARIGRRKTALAWAARALDLDGKDSAVLYNVACVYVTVGKTDGALRYLRRVVRSRWRKEWIRHDPEWIALRGMKEFQRLTT
jgi:adenylate cyclase